MFGFVIFYNAILYISVVFPDVFYIANFTDIQVYVVCPTKFVFVKLQYYS